MNYRMISRVMGLILLAISLVVNAIFSLMQWRLSR